MASRFPWKSDPGATCLTWDVTKDGRKEMFASYRYRSEEGWVDLLVALSPKGEKFWEFSPGRYMNVQGRVFSQDFVVHRFDTVELDGRPTLLGFGHQNPFYPSQIAVLDAQSGVLKGEYYHTGYLNVHLIYYVDGNGKQGIILAGMDNPGPGMGHKALVVLGSPTGRGSEVEPAPLDSFGFTSTIPLRYDFLAPGIDVCEMNGIGEHFSHLVIDDHGRLMVWAGNNLTWTRIVLMTWGFLLVCIVLWYARNGQSGPPQAHTGGNPADFGGSKHPWLVRLAALNFFGPRSHSRGRTRPRAPEFLFSFVEWRYSYVRVRIVVRTCSYWQ